MVKSANTILFIAECKIWKGAAQIQPSIDQLLGYLTWRQSKAALILFVRSKNIDNMLEEIPKQVKPIRTMFARIAYNPRGSYSLSFILRVEKTMR